MNPRKNEPGVRDDGDKLRFDLIPVRPLEEIVKVLTYGGKKYGDDNWRKGMSWSRHFAAAMRHSWSWMRGETFDPESGYHHLAHAAVSFLFLMEYNVLTLGTDDRISYNQKTSQVVPEPIPETLPTRRVMKVNLEEPSRISQAGTYGY